MVESCVVRTLGQTEFGKEPGLRVSEEPAFNGLVNNKRLNHRWTGWHILRANKEAGGSRACKVAVNRNQFLI